MQGKYSLENKLPPIRYGLMRVNHPTEKWITLLKQNQKNVLEVNSIFKD